MRRSARSSGIAPPLPRIVRRIPGISSRTRDGPHGEVEAVAMRDGAVIDEREGPVVWTTRRAEDLLVGDVHHHAAFVGADTPVDQGLPPVVADRDDVVGEATREALLRARGASTWRRPENRPRGELAIACRSRITGMRCAFSASALNTRKSGRLWTCTLRYASRRCSAATRAAACAESQVAQELVCQTALVELDVAAMDLDTAVALPFRLARAPETHDVDGVSGVPAPPPHVEPGSRRGVVRARSCNDADVGPERRRRGHEIGGIGERHRPTCVVRSRRSSTRRCRR